MIPVLVREAAVRDAGPAEDPLGQAFELAYFLRGDRDSALQIVTEAMLRLAPASAAQDKRLYYRRGARPRNGKAWEFRTKVSLEERHLLQRLVYVMSEPHERSEERSRGAGLTEEDMVVRYVKQLVQITMKRSSFYVTLGLGRLLYNYTTKETAKIHDALVPGEHALKSDDYYRSRKARLMRELVERFGEFLKVTQGARGEERFEPAESQEALFPLVRTSLGFFVPWGTPCLSNQDDADSASEKTSASGPADENEREIERMHAVVHPDCFHRLTTILGIDPPGRRLAIPHFLLKSGEGGKLPPKDRVSPPPLNQDERRAIQDRLEEEAGRRKAGGSHLLRILVDGIEQGSWDVRKDARVRLGVDERAELIEVWGSNRSGAFLLGCHLLRNIEASGQTRPNASTAVLEGGQRLSFTISPSPNAFTADGGAFVEIAYRETHPFRAAALWLERVGLQLSGSYRPSERRPLSGALPTFALLVALGVTLAVYLRSTHAPSSQPAELGSEGTPAPGATSGTQPPPAVPSGAPRAPENAGPSAPAFRGGGPREIAPESGGPGVTRGLTTRLQGVPLADVRRVAVEASGNGLAADQVRDLLIKNLQPTGAFAVVESRQDADAVLRVTASVIGPQGSEIVVSVRLINRAGTVIWPVSGRARTHNGSPAHVTSRVTGELLRDLQEATAKPKD